MDPKEYQQLAARTSCDHVKAGYRFTPGYIASNEEPTKTDEKTLIPARFNHAVIGLMGEVGELAGVVEKVYYYGKETALDLTNIKEELGDCLWYIALLCNTFDLDLGEIMTANIAKLKTRYPEKYTDELAAEENRDREKEREAMEKPTGFFSCGTIITDEHVEQFRKLLEGHQPDRPEKERQALEELTANIPPTAKKEVHRKEMLIKPLPAWLQSLPPGTPLTTDNCLRGDLGRPCDKCGNPATIGIAEVKDGEQRQYWYCDEHQPYIEE